MTTKYNSDSPIDYSRYDTIYTLKQHTTYKTHKHMNLLPFRKTQSGVAFMFQSIYKVVKTIRNPYLGYFYSYYKYLTPAEYTLHTLMGNPDEALFDE